jgi:uncharacterized protein (TIGR04255 family)
MASDELKDDPIVEALLEIRFDTRELPEIVTGRLSDLPRWKGGSVQRLAMADVPAVMRAAMPPPMRHAPLLEIKGVSGIGAVRIGGSGLSLHFFAPYAGWDQAVFPTIRDVIDGLFGALPAMIVTRLGLRYVNIFTTGRHHMTSVGGLALKIELAGTILKEPMNLTFAGPAPPPNAETHYVTTRVVARELLQGPVAADAAAAVDIDVYTFDGYRQSSSDAVKAWVGTAHSIEKSVFRKLIPDDLFEKLRKHSHAIH